MYVALSILILAAAVLVHEAGHFVAARLCGIPVRQFSAGFGPALLKVQKNGTVYALRLFPLGGYVEPERGAVEGSALWKQLLVYLAGPAANAAGAVLLAAAAVGWLLAGKVPAWLVPVRAAQGGCMFVAMIVAAIFQNCGALDVAGPVGTIALMSRVMESASGPAVLGPAVLLNLAVAFTNLFPVPAFDGGRALMALFRVPSEWQMRIAGACLGLLLVLAALVTYADVVRLLR
jgi:regulator of sigma E protease